MQKRGRDELSEMIRAGNARGVWRHLSHSTEQTEAEIASGSDCTTTPLHYAVMQNQPNCLKVLLDAGARLDVENSAGDTPLHVACATRASACFRMLVERGADIEALGQIGHSPKSGIHPPTEQPVQTRLGDASTCFRWVPT